MLTVLSSATFANAESTQWSRNIGSLKFSRFNQGLLSSVQVSVTYKVRVTNDATGAVIPSGSTVPAGTKVNFDFLPHTSSDISWFAAGNFSDSPYGRWTNNAVAPSDICSRSNFVPRKAGGSYGDYSRKRYGTAATYAVNPPVKSIDGLSGFNCTASGSNQDCTLTTNGTFPVSFVFETTPGKIWGALSSKGGATCTSATAPDGRPTFAVPQRIIPYTITVIGEVPPDDEEAPVGAPTLAVSSGGACVAGAAHSISMTATDSQNDQVRYLIDWDNDNAVDQFVPSPGFVNSGTTQTASRTYTTAGSKTVKVRAEDSNGWLSNWSTISFSCADSATVGLNESDNGNVNGGEGGGGTSPDLTIRAIPSLVRSGNTTRVHWNATNVSSCNVTATNGDNWTGLESVVGGEVSGAITGAVDYTLSCVDLDGGIMTKTAKVQILPIWQEQ